MNQILNKDTLQDLNLKQSGAINVELLHKYLITGIKSCVRLNAVVFFLNKCICFMVEVLKIKSRNSKFAACKNHIKNHLSGYA